MLEELLGGTHTLVVCCTFHRSAGELQAGDCFCTYACLLGQPHPATLVAGSYCELYSLSRASLEELVAEWPDMERMFRALGECLVSCGLQLQRSRLHCSECELWVPGVGSDA